MQIEMNAGQPFALMVMLFVLAVLVISFGVPLVLLWLSLRGRNRQGPRFLGVCWRLAGERKVSVGQVRLLAAIGIILSGIVPGLLVYVLLGVFMEQWAGRRVAAAPPPLPFANLRPAVGPGRIGRYPILGTLGRGGMGTVYLGRDEALGRDVAIKVIHDRFGGVENVLRRFAAEARAVAQLSSPHIVQVYDFDPVAVPPHLVMELVRGPSVQELVRRRGKAAVGTVADCGRQVLQGLATAHAAGVVHRDVKPGNVLRGPDGTYKLTDFGLARSLEREQSLTASGSIIGTLHYMAPEVAAGEEATAVSDLYSLGVTLYQMLAGTTPFPDDSPLKLLRRIAAETPAPISAHRDDVPPQFEAWLEKLLAHDPRHRFSSAAAARAALDGLAIPAAAADDGFAAVGFAVEDFVPGATSLSLAATAPAFAAPLAAETPPPMHREQVDSIIRAALRLEAQGKSLMGDDTVLEIARELHVDSRFVRRALADHRADRVLASAPPLPAAAPPRSPAGRLVTVLLALVVGGVLVVMNASSPASRKPRATMRAPPGSEVYLNGRRLPN